MVEYDLTPRMAPNLDKHLVFPLLEFLQERQLYDDNHILKAKIDLLNNTNMVDYAMDFHKTLYHTEDVPQDMVERRDDVVARLKSLEDAAAPLVAFLQNPAAVQELRADKHYNLQMLNDKYQIGAAQIEALYQYAKFQFECGNYSGVADYLYQYRALCTNSERSLNALWENLAAEVLMQNWDIALEELNRLKEIIDSKNFSSPINQVQSRIWLMHWSLFIFFNHDNGRTQIIDLFNQDKYLNAIQTSAPHLLRYLATAFIVNKTSEGNLPDNDATISVKPDNRDSAPQESPTLVASALEKTIDFAASNETDNIAGNLNNTATSGTTESDKSKGITETSEAKETKNIYATVDERFKGNTQTGETDEKSDSSSITLRYGSSMVTPTNIFVQLLTSSHSILPLNNKIAFNKLS
ncbi:unnamed protein product [Vicia faba]|uniref:Eukaryotic translation initiation factor 3 subunit E N-terminal domain-containing protein n=1 Tax=Vicia faba TaxID=3906 RepID=A0AAV1AKD3_VICFA|nr:unnamed protein product [Vicia faba]